MRALLAKVHGERQARSLVRREREERRAREHARIRTKRRKAGEGETNTDVRMHTVTREADEHTRIRAEKEVEKHAHAQEGAEVKRRQNLSMRALLAKASGTLNGTVRGVYMMFYCDRSKYHIGN